MAAAIMFQDFSFSRQRSPPSHEAERAQMHLSPTALPSEYFTHTSPSPPPAPPPPSVGELAQILDRQTLQVVDVEMDPDYDIPASEEPALPNITKDVPTYSRISTASLRLQRQAAARKHCNSSHLKNMSKLVERMVAEEDQCTVSEPKASTSSRTCPNPTDDEAIDMQYSPIKAEDEKLYTLRFRRAGESINKHGAVTKKIRMRRHPKVAKMPKTSSK